MSSQKIPSEKIGIAIGNHIGIAVKNLETSIKFYKAITGLEPVSSDTWSSPGMAKDSGEDKVSVKWATFHLQNMNIDLLQFEEPKLSTATYKANQPGAMHFCFEVNDIKEVYNRMKSAGLEFAGETYIVKDGEAREGVGTGVAYFDGPDGEHLEIIMPKGPFERDK